MTTLGTSAFYDRSLSDLSSLRGRAEQLQAALGTGERLTRGSDDPVAASRLRMLSRIETLSAIDEGSAGRATADLSLADAAMSSMADFVIRATELATQAAGVGLNDVQRATIGEEMGQIHSALVSLANGRNSAGHALFGGNATDDAYVLDAAGNASYAGTTGSGPLQLGAGIAVTPGMTGPEFLKFNHGGTQRDLLSTVKGLADALSGTAADPQTAARDALGALGAGLDSLTTGQTIVGTRLAWIDLTNDMRTNQSELHSDEQARIGGSDIADTMSRLQQIMTALEASQAGFARLSGLSLFDAIR